MKSMGLRPHRPVLGGRRRGCAGLDSLANLEVKRWRRLPMTQC